MALYRVLKAPMRYLTTPFLFLAAILFSFLVTLTWFRGLSNQEFIYIHDEFLLLNLSEAITSLYVRNPVNFGSSASIEILVTFFDRLFYLFGYAVTKNILWIQFCFYWLKLMLLLIIPFVGFKRLATLYDIKLDLRIIILISFWYGFNTYTLTYWNTNAFSLPALLCYSLAPLTLYYLHRAITSADIEAKIRTVMLSFIMSFAFYLFSVFVFLAGMYVLILLLVEKKKFIMIVKNVILLVLLYVPFLAFPSILLELFTGQAQAANFTGNEAHGNLSGGFLYQLLMWYAWPMYTIWEPRNIFSFYQYFRMPYAIIAPFIIYGIILYPLIKRKIDRNISIYLLLFLTFLFFIKGAQEPLGNIYLYLLQHSFVFNIFRSPDSKFGFALILILSILLMLSASYYKKKTFAIFLFIVIIIQSTPLFTGVAIRGENNSVSSDRIIAIPQDYKDTAAFLNNHSSPYGYIIPIPPQTFTNFKLNSDTHLGQDLLPKLTHNPFVYISSGVGISARTYNHINRIFTSGDLQELEKFPIRFFVYRKDIVESKNDVLFITRIASASPPVFTNKSFEVYQFSYGVPIIQSSSTDFDRLDPVTYTLTFRNIKADQPLYFNQNFNANWKLYGIGRKKLSLWDRITFFWQRPLFEDSHSIHNGFANRWMVSPNVIKKELPLDFYKMNADGTIDFTLTLFYKPQAQLYLGLLLSFSYLGILAGILLVFRYNRKN